MRTRIGIARLDVAERAIAQLKGPARLTIEKAPDDSVSPLATIPGDQFCEAGLEPIDYLVRPICVRGGFTIPYGQPKVGKTTFVAHAVSSMLDPRRPFLDDVQPIDGPALWLDLDQPRRVSQRRFAEAGADSRLLIYRGPSPSLGQLLATIDHHGIRLLVVDSLSRWLLLDNENDNAEWTRKLDPIQRALQERDVTVIAIDHAGKTDAPTGRNLRGGSAKLAHCDIACEVKAEGPPIDGRRRLCITSREEVVPDLIVRLVDGCFVLEGSAHAVTASAHAEKILKGIRLGHNRKETLAGYLNVSTKTLEGWIAPLVSNGSVHAERAKTTGTPFIYSIPVGTSAKSPGSSERAGGLL